MRILQWITTTAFALFATTSIAASIDSLDLFNAATGARIGAMADNLTIDFRTVGKGLSIKANASGAFKSVRFVIGTHRQIENAAPYFINGDTNNKPNAWSPALGAQTLTVTLHAGAGATGATLATRALKINVVDTTVIPPTATIRSLELLNASTGVVIGPLTDNLTIDFKQVGKNLSVRAEVTGTMKSVKFAVGSHRHVENAAPYYINSNAGTQIKPWTPALGAQILTVSLHSNSDATGTTLATRTVKLNVIDTPPDTTAPTGVVTGNPATGSVVQSNQVVSLTAAANDNVGVALVQLFENDVDTGKSSAVSPYRLDWTAPKKPGTYELKVLVKDAANNFAFSNSLRYVVPSAGPPPCPTGMECVTPNDDLNKLVNETRPAGTKFYLRRGIYRHANLRPKAGMHLVGEPNADGTPGAVLNGAQVLTGITKVAGANLWIWKGPARVEPKNTIPGACITLQTCIRSGRCEAPTDASIDPLTTPYRCFRANNLYLNDEPLWHAQQLDQVKPGRWYYDYPTGTVYIGDDPSGKTVELSTTQTAISGTSADVVIEGLRVEKYANPVQSGAVSWRSSSNGSNWTLRNSTITLNHAVGVQVGTHSVVKNNRIVRNGQAGIGGGVVNTLIERNEIAHNLWGGFRTTFEGGGSKFANTTGLRLRCNYVHSNNGPGLWTDINNYQTLIEHNSIIGNREAGIFHEISYDAVIRRNFLKRNGPEISAAQAKVGYWPWNPQILISSSSNVEVYENKLETSNQNGIFIAGQRRGTGTRGVWEAKNNYVHHNDITAFGDRGKSGLEADFNTAVYWARGANVFDFNTYRTNTSNNLWSRWGTTSWSRFRDYSRNYLGAIEKKALKYQATNGTVTGTLDQALEPMELNGVLLANPVADPTNGFIDCPTDKRDLAWD